MDDTHALGVFPCLASGNAASRGGVALSVTPREGTGPRFPWVEDHPCPSAGGLVGPALPGPRPEVQGAEQAPGQAAHGLAFLRLCLQFEASDSQAKP